MQLFGQTVKLRLSDSSEIDADVEYIMQQNDGDVMVIFKTNKSVEELIPYRKISIDIVWWSYSGLKIPNSAIIEEGGINYIIRNRTGYKDKILIKIKKQNKKYAIIENYTKEDLKTLGYDQEEIYNMKSISLYDEVLANPSE